MNIKIGKRDIFIILAALAPHREDAFYKKVFDKISLCLIDSFFKKLIHNKNYIYNFVSCLFERKKPPETSRLWRRLVTS